MRGNEVNEYRMQERHETILLNNFLWQNTDSRQTATHMAQDKKLYNVMYVISVKVQISFAKLNNNTKNTLQKREIFSPTTLRQ